MLSELLHPPANASPLDADAAPARDVLFGPTLADLPHATDPADALAWPPAPPRFGLALAAVAMTTVTLAALVVLPVSIAPAPQVTAAMPASSATVAASTPAPAAALVEARARDTAPIRFARASAHDARQER